MGNGGFSVIVCRSVHHVMKAERLLKDAGISLKIINTPRSISSDCGVVIRVSTADCPRAEKLCREAGVAVQGAHPFGQQ